MHGGCTTTDVWQTVFICCPCCCDFRTWLPQKLSRRWCCCQSVSRLCLPGLSVGCDMISGTSCTSVPRSKWSWWLKPYYCSCSVAQVTPVDHIAWYSGSDLEWAASWWLCQQLLHSSDTFSTLYALPAEWTQYAQEHEQPEGKLWTVLTATAWSACKHKAFIWFVYVWYLDWPWDIWNSQFFSVPLWLNCHLSTAVPCEVCLLADTLQVCYFLVPALHVTHATALLHYCPCLGVVQKEKRRVDDSSFGPQVGCLTCGC